MPFVGCVIDKEVQELPRPSAPALSPGYAPLIKHIQTVTLHCRDAADGLTSHFNHKSATRPEARVTKSAGVLGPLLLRRGKTLFFFRQRPLAFSISFSTSFSTFVLSTATHEEPLAAASRHQVGMLLDPTCEALTSTLSVQSRLACK